MKGIRSERSAQRFDVVIIGAGPAGAVAATLLVKRGFSVLVLERQNFPRFSIGESLLPQCMEFIEEAGMLDAVNAARFQVKNGAVFQRRACFSQFDFSEQFSSGWTSTYQVQRARFDKILADTAAEAGADIRYEHVIHDVDLDSECPSVHCVLPDGTRTAFSARFLLDASGFGRVLPRLLRLEVPSEFPVRKSLFAHVSDRLDGKPFDRNKILITVHPRHADIWFWLIPFSNGRSSIGVVGNPALLDAPVPDDAAQPEHHRLRALVDEDPVLGGLLADAEWDTPAMAIAGYSANVRQLSTSQYALLGNAGEFLDPVFSSGVTIAMQSASMAAAVLERQLRGETVDWQAEYAAPLSRGIRTFRAFVSAWYDGRLQDIIFHPKQSGGIRRMICSVLAGYAWDETNPFVQSPERRLGALWHLCRPTGTSQ